MKKTKIYVVKDEEAYNVGYTTCGLAYKTKERAVEEAKKMFIEKLKDCAYSDEDIQDILNDPDWVVTDSQDESLIVLFRDAKKFEFFCEVREWGLVD